MDLFLFKILEKTKRYLAADDKLYMYTLYELFSKPFEIIQFFLNELSYMVNMFKLKFRSRQLYLLDNLDNLALKNLSVFKTNKTHDILKKIAKEAKEEM